MKTPVIMILLCGLLYSEFAASSAGKTLLAMGKVVAENTETTQTRDLARRSPIYRIDSVTTGEQSQAQFSMTDGGMLSLSALSRVLISEYRYDAKTGQGSASIELLKGGLRSISGLIKKSGGDYTVMTPVGSIGVRGTHFAVETSTDAVYFAVFDGNIDVRLTSGQAFALGSDEAYSFAQVKLNGELNYLTQLPAIFTTRYVKPTANANNASTVAASAGTGTASTQVSSSAPGYDRLALSSMPATQFDDQVYLEQLWQRTDFSEILDRLSERNGLVTFDNVSSFDIKSTQGSVNDLNMAIIVNLDEGTVPAGLLNFSDQGGEWLAAFSGQITVDALQLSIDAASHGFNSASGTISGRLINDDQAISGAFELFETGNSDISASGSFIVEK